MWLEGDANYTDFKLVEEKKIKQPSNQIHILKGSLTNNNQSLNLFGLNLLTSCHSMSSVFRFDFSHFFCVETRYKGLVINCRRLHRPKYTPTAI